MVRFLWKSPVLNATTPERGIVMHARRIHTCVHVQRRRGSPPLSRAAARLIYHLRSLTAFAFKTRRCNADNYETPELPPARPIVVITGDRLLRGGVQLGRRGGTPVICPFSATRHLHSADRSAFVALRRVFPSYFNLPLFSLRNSISEVVLRVAEYFFTLCNRVLSRQKSDRR